MIERELFSQQVVEHLSICEVMPEYRQNTINRLYISYTKSLSFETHNLKPKWLFSDQTMLANCKKPTYTYPWHEIMKATQKSFLRLHLYTKITHTCPPTLYFFTLAFFRNPSCLHRNVIFTTRSVILLL